MRPPSDTTLRRNLLGLLGLASLVVGIYSHVRPPDVASVEFVQNRASSRGLCCRPRGWRFRSSIDSLAGSLPCWLECC